MSILVYICTCVLLLYNLGFLIVFCFSGWSVSARARITLINQINPQNSHSRGIVIHIYVYYISDDIVLYIQNNVINAIMYMYMYSLVVTLDQYTCTTHYI